MEKSPTSIEAETWDWQWALVGNETPSEAAKLSEMLSAVMVFISEINAGKAPRWLTLAGNPGCGKTHLADRVRWFLHRHGAEIYNRTTRADSDPTSANYLSCYAYAQEGAVLARWGKIIEGARNSDMTLFNRACKDHFKVIDDLGVDCFDREGKATPFAIQKMGELLDRRLRKWTVITTNFSRSQLAKEFDSRISSRLMRDGSVIVDCFDVRDFSLRQEAMRKAA